MARTKERSFGQVLRDRRRQLDLTQEEVARRIKTSTPYIGHLESAKRHPSDKIVTRLAEVLGLDRRELFFLANPRAQALLTPSRRPTRSRRGKIFARTNRCGASTTSPATRWKCSSASRCSAKSAPPATSSIYSTRSATPSADSPLRRLIACIDQMFIRLRGERFWPAQLASLRSRCCRTRLR